MAQREARSHEAIVSFPISIPFFGGLNLKHYDFESSVDYWLGNATQSYEHALNTELLKHGITRRQSHVLIWLSKKEQLCQSELAELMMIEPPTLVRILDCLEKAKLIERVKIHNDRRKKTIRLLPGAEQIWEKIIECMDDVVAVTLGNFSAEQIPALIAGLRRLHDNVQTETPPVVQSVS